MMGSSAATKSLSASIQTPIVSLPTSISVASAKTASAGIVGSGVNKDADFQVARRYRGIYS